MQIRNRQTLDITWKFNCEKQANRFNKLSKIILALGFEMLCLRNCNFAGIFPGGHTLKL